MSSYVVGREGIPPEEGQDNDPAVLEALYAANRQAVIDWKVENINVLFDLDTDDKKRAAEALFDLPDGTLNEDEG